MAAELDPASPDAREVTYAVPANPLTRRVPDMKGSDDAAEHHHHHGGAESPAPSAMPSASEVSPEPTP